MKSDPAVGARVPRESWDAAGAVIASRRAEALPRPLAHYRLQSILGEGGYGCVYLAWDLSLQREVALKVLTEAGTQRAAAALREARLAARLEHPALVRVYEMLTTPEGPAIAMERVHGETLAALLRSGPLALPPACRLVRQVAAALAEAHAQGLVHGDVKPSNLMRTPGGEIRILDFGLARRIDAVTASDAVGGDVGGTLAYLAPELLLGHAPSAQSDIYALGLVLFELLSGTRPFGTCRDATLAHGILYGQTPALTATAVADAPGVAGLVAAMLSRDPRQRPDSMSEVCRRLDALLPGPSAVADVRTMAGPRLYRGLKASLLPVALLMSVALLVAQTRDRGDTRPAPVRHVTAELAGAEHLLRNFDEPGAVARAIARLDAVVAGRPEHAAATAALAIAYCLRFTDEGRDPAWLGRARAAAQLALRADDQLALAHAAHGWALDLAGEAAPAEAAYARALALEPGNFFALQGQVRLFTRERQFQRAEAAIEDALTRWPEERLFYDALGTLRYQQADYSDAERAFRRSIALKPDSPFAYANLNAVLVRQGRLDEAMTVLQQGLAIRPHARLYTNLGTALYARGRYLDAVDAFERALSGPHGEPNDYLKWANLGDALRQIPGRDADARRAFTRAMQLVAPLLERTPRDATLVSRAALYAAKQADAQRARRWGEQALSTAPGSGDVAFRTAVAAELVGDRVVALARLERALAAGYPRSLIESEPELIALRGDRRWHDLALMEPTPDE